MTSHCKWWFAFMIVGLIGVFQVPFASGQALTARPLQIDFTLPLAALVEGAAQATGISFDETNGHFVILHNRNQLTVVTDEAEPIRQVDITTEESLSFQGVTVDAEGQLDYVVSSSGEVYRVDAETIGIGMFEPVDAAALEVASMAYDPDLRSLYAINENGEKYLYQLVLDGGAERTALDARLADFQIVGADFHDGYLYALSHRPDQSLHTIVELTRQGAIVRAWSFEAPAPLAPAGIAVLNPDRGEFAIAHDNDEATITLLEDPAAAEGPEAEGIPLDLVRLFELGHRQPSGVTYDDALSALYLVTDFGEVLRSDVACHGTSKLFDLEGVLQGEVEAIELGADDALVVLKSDLQGGPPRLLSYGLDGQLTGELTVPLESPDHVFSGLAYDRANQVYYLVTGTDDEDTAEVPVLYRVDLQGQVQTTPLPPALADYTTVGLDIDPSGTRLWLVTAENYVVLIGLDDMDILGVRTINETPVPSGIAVSDTMIYIISDTDQSLVYGFRTPN